MMNTEEITRISETVEDLAQKVGTIFDGHEVNICMNVISVVSASILSMIPSEERMDAMKALFGVIAARAVVDALGNVFGSSEDDEENEDSEKTHTVQ
jgi:hypothetical protein